MQRRKWDGVEHFQRSKKMEMTEKGDQFQLA